MKYSVFQKNTNNALKEPMFFGNPVNLSRFDQQKHHIFESLIEKQLAFFWRPEEVDVSRDQRDFNSLPKHEQHIFVSNLKYQTLLDSIQGRSPNLALLPIVSLPELETWIETWSFSETIHSRSYSHIIRNIFNEPQLIFDGIVNNEEIQKRAQDISCYYDVLIHMVQFHNLHGDGSIEFQGKTIEVNLYELKKALYLCLGSVNALEAIRFYVSFACSFSFAERALMEGNAKIIKFIARDEALHLNGTQSIINLMQDGLDDPDMVAIAKECKPQMTQIFIDAAKQEKQWADYLFKDGSMIGLNAEMLCQYVEYITSQRMANIKLESPYSIKSNPLPWMDKYLKSDNVQVAPQEVEISSYLVGQVNSAVDTSQLSF